jgi:hypothetical protein
VSVWPLRRTMIGRLLLIESPMRPRVPVIALFRMTRVRFVFGIASAVNWF